MRRPADEGDKDGLVSKKEQKMLQDLISSIGGTGPKKDDAASFLRFVDNEKKPSASEFINFVDKQVRCARIPTRAPCLCSATCPLPLQPTEGSAPSTPTLAEAG